MTRLPWVGTRTSIGLIGAVRLHRLRPVGDAVLVAQLVGNVLEGLRQVLHLEREEGQPAGFGREVLQDLVAVGLRCRVRLVEIV